MLRAVAKNYIEGQPIVGRDVFKILRIFAHSKAAGGDQTVVSCDAPKSSAASRPDGSAPPPLPPPPPPPPPQQSRRAWSAGAALALTASIGGVYLYRKYNGSDEDTAPPIPAKSAAGAAEEPAAPPTAEGLPAHAQFLLVGGGTAAFAAMRAIRSARPDAQVLIVSEERALPYMRPPLSKELWREEDLAERALDPDTLSFRQWNGKRRSVVYEPGAFYTPAERLAEGAGGAGVARGWRVLRLDPARRRAHLAAPGAAHELTYDQCLIATGARARRIPALASAARGGRSLALRGVRDAARLAAALEAPDTRSVAVVGGGLLAAELAAALAERLRGSGRRVLQVCREEAPLAQLLPHYLAADAARRLTEAGVTLVTDTEVTDSEITPDGEGAVTMRVRSAGAEARLGADLVVECAGADPAAEVAAASGLELVEGGVLVNAELQARAGVWAAGDVASYYDVVLGRRRVEHHDHAVLSGRLAGENMAGDTPRHYKHQSMFWSDLGPQLGYEAIGIIDSRLPTVGVFSADAVSDEAALNEAQRSEATAVLIQGPEEAVAAVAAGPAGAAVAAGPALPRRFERGVVFYLRDERVVGVLLWNLFNRMHVARQSIDVAAPRSLGLCPQVLAQGSFEDLFEVAKLFSLPEEE